MVLIIEISKIGNILATENQQARINGVIEVKKACICTKLKQIQLRTTKNTPSSSDEKFYTDYFIWHVVYGLPAIFDIISFRLICKIFCCQKIIYKMIDTKYDITYNIDRRYSECQSGINY